jgi:hypothetical protein
MTLCLCWLNLSGDGFYVTLQKDQGRLHSHLMQCGLGNRWSFSAQKFEIRFSNTTIGCANKNYINSKYLPGIICNIRIRRIPPILRAVRDFGLGAAMKLSF